MALVTVKPKFQVTIPAKVRERIDLREGDLLDATVVAGGILLRPKAVVDRGAVADRVAALLRSAKPSRRDAVRSEAAIMADVIGEVAKTRAARRKRRG